MPNIPNLGVATYDAQCARDNTDDLIDAAASQQTGVISGGTVTADTGMVLNVSTCVPVLLGGQQSSVTGTTVTVSAANGTQDRRDIVIWTSGTGFQVIAGTQLGAGGWSRTQPAANLPPVKPAIPANSVVLAEVYVPTGVMTITTAMIVDKRMFLTLISDTGWVPLGGWANSWGAAGGPGGLASYRVTGNIVRLGGAISSGAVGSPAFTLPSGARPNYGLSLSANMDNNGGSVYSAAVLGVSTGGVCTPYFASGTYFFLDGISFTTDISDTGWVPLGGWANSWGAAGGPGGLASYRVTGNIVRLGGAISSGAVGSPAFTLPSGARPSYGLSLSANMDNNGGSVYSAAVLGVSTGGVCTPYFASGTYFMLDGISFTTD